MSLPPHTLGELLSIAELRRLSFIITWDGYNWKFELRGQNVSIRSDEPDEGASKLLAKVIKKQNSKSPVHYDPVQLAALIEKVPADGNHKLYFTADFRKGATGRVFSVQLLAEKSVFSWPSHRGISSDASDAMSQALHKAGLLG